MDSHESNNDPEVQTFDTLHRNGMKILDIDPETYFNFVRSKDHRFNFNSKEKLGSAHD